MPSISLKDLYVSFQEKKKTTIALNKINMDIESKKINVLVGFSGCGKTTLLRTIAGLENYQGTILVDGINIEEMNPEDLTIGYAFQSITLLPNLTIFDNIAYPLKLMGCGKEEIKRRVHEIAEEFGISFLLTRKPSQISRGQQQRVQIAKALVKNPSILLADEPLSSIDEKSRQALRILIKQAIYKHGATCIYVTHEINEAMSLADNLYVMDNGKIVESGKPLEVYNSGNKTMNLLIGKECINDENL